MNFFFAKPVQSLHHLLCLENEMVAPNQDKYGELIQHKELFQFQNCLYLTQLLNYDHCFLHHIQLVHLNLVHAGPTASDSGLLILSFVLSTILCYWTFLH
jgi:hypothetical protein